MSYKKMWFELMDDLASEAAWNEDNKDYITKIVARMARMQADELEGKKDE